ncbi:DUF928 domain-containing protein [Scytonema sp. NUACC26]|uniref:DUF928 domain-containing protein n=1 Tax=Scytonema sp. NUACC26 TaxID=3140176 RepID=UPI0034DC8F83
MNFHQHLLTSLRFAHLHAKTNTTTTKLLMHKLKPFFLMTLTLLSFISYSTSILAQPSVKASKNSNTSTRVPPPTQDDGSSQGRPSRRTGTGSRGTCPAVSTPLTALVPSNNITLSVEENPTFWFFVPYKSEAIDSGEFSLQDEANNDVYRTPFTLPKGQGIVSVTVPPEISLVPNKKYKWYFKLYCKMPNLQTSPKESDFVYGLVQRVTLRPQIENQLKVATAPLSRITIYSQNAIWHSAITELAKLRIAEPRNPTVNNNWANLLKSIGLENLAKEPIVGEVKTKK